MVTHINDKNIAYLSSGGEFNVAVDSDSQLWVWGRNEFGQVNKITHFLRCHQGWQ